MSTIHFTPLGGATEIGANSYMLEVDGLRILLDCGLHPKKEGRDALPELARLKEAPHAVIVSHGHIDHCGAVPYLVKKFPSVVPYATKPTRFIMERMLHNSVAVMGILKREKNIPEYPLYEHADVDTAMRKMCGIDMDTEFGIHPGSSVRIQFSSSGHVLGGATVRVSTPGHTLYYTGDICTVDQELMGGYSPPPDAGTIDTLIIESTHGATEQADEVEYLGEVDRFADNIVEVLDRSGCVLAPSFALGRAQEVLNIIARMQNSGRIPAVPVYASGLGRKVYDVYSKFSHHLRAEAFLSPLSQFLRVTDAWDPKAVDKLLQDPCIIVATSGMMIENTPSAMIARRMVADTRHGIFFVGYCDPETLGYKLRTAKVGDAIVFATGSKPVELKLDNIQWFQFSAHASRKALQGVVEKFNPKNLVFVHGDAPAVDWMRKNCGDGCDKFVPRIGETIALRT